MGGEKQGIISAARKLRRDQTRAEELLWIYLNNKGMCGVKFRRQHPIAGFVVDFFCPSRRLAIELDGGIHLRQKEADAERQRTIEDRGVKFLRFKNEAVFNSLDSVLKQIKQVLFPSPRSGEGCRGEGTCL